jgi:hypothetical protein
MARAQYKKPLREYCAIYDTRERQLKRWIATGKAADPAPDLPPLDDPPAMVTWWERRMAVRVPSKILALVVEAGLKPSEENDSGESIDVDSLDITNLDSLRQARRYLAAVDQKLSAAYRSGSESQIRRWQKPFNEAFASVQKAESAQRDALKIAGELIPKDELLRELSTLLELLRQMRSTMRRRIAARLGDLSPELLERIGAVVDHEREGEDGVLRQLKEFRSIEQIDFHLERER